MELIKRQALPGEKIKITSNTDGSREYQKGDYLTVQYQVGSELVRCFGIMRLLRGIEYMVVKEKRQND